LSPSISHHRVATPNDIFSLVFLPVQFLTDVFKLIVLGVEAGTFIVGLGELLDGPSEVSLIFLELILHFIVLIMLLNGFHMLVPLYYLV